VTEFRHPYYQNVPVQRGEALAAYAPSGSVRIYRPTEGSTSPALPLFPGCPWVGCFLCPTNAPKPQTWGGPGPLSLAFGIVVGGIVPPRLAI